MDTKYIPGGGAKFSIVKFSDRLKGATKYGSLRPSQDNIMKVVRQSASHIRGGTFDSAAALHKFKSLDQDASLATLRAAGQVFKHLSAAGQAKSAAIPPAPSAAAGKDAPVHKPYVGINRDPNFQKDYQGLSVQERDSGRFALRGAAAKASLNYEKMTKLGGSASARDLQKDAFTKLQQTGGGLVKGR